MSACLEKSSTDQFRELSEEYLLYLKEMKHRAKTTLNSKAFMLESWRKYCDVNNIDYLYPSSMDIQMFSKRPCRNAGGGIKERSASSQRNSLFALKGFFGWLTDWKDFESDPSRRTEAVAQKPPDTEQYLPLDLFYGLPLTTFEDVRLRFALGLGWFVGLRRSEIARLQCKDLQGEVLSIPRSKTGEGVSRKVVRFPWLQVSAFLADDHDRLGFPGSEFRDHWVKLMTERVRQGDPTDSLIPDLTKKSITKLEPEGDHVEYLYKNAFGSKNGLPFTPHQLRHSFGNNMMMLADVERRPTEPQLKELMGHEKLDTLIKWYCNPMRAYKAVLDSEMSREVTKL